MGLSGIFISEISQIREKERHILYDITYMWNLTYGTNEPTYETEIDSRIQRTNWWLPKGRQREGLGEIGEGD